MRAPHHVAIQTPWYGPYLPAINYADRCSQEILRKLERRAENNFMSYWNNPLKYECIPPPPGEIDELKLLGGQEIVIQQSRRSHSGSPGPLHSHVSHVRTQPQHVQPHDHTHAMHEYMGSYDDASAVESSPITLHSYPSPTGFDPFHFVDINEAFPSSTVPSYEQIMHASNLYQGSMRTQGYSHPSPELSFHPAGYSHGSERFDPTAYPPRVQQHMEGLGGASFDTSGSRDDAWGSFVGDLMSSGSPSQYGHYGI